MATYYFHIGDNVDYHLNNITLNIGQTYQSVTGVVDWYNSNSNYRINPREQNDIVALPGLDANFSADQTSVFVGTTVNFTDLTTGGTTPYSYSWDLDGDGFEDETVQNPSFTYNIAGVYTAELTVTDDVLDTDTETKVDYITVSVNPFANLVINEVDADQIGTDSTEFIELFDGGVADPIPVAKAHTMGADKIIVIRTISGKVPDSDWHQRLKFALKKQTLSPLLAHMLSEHEQSYRRATEFIRNPPPGVSVLELSPPEILKSRTFGSSSVALIDDYALGYQVGMNSVAKIHSWLNLGTQHC